MTDSLSFMDKPLPEMTSEERLYEAHHRLFRRNLAEAKRDIGRSATNAARYIEAAAKSGDWFEDANELMNNLETEIRAALLAVLLARRAYAQRFEPPVTGEVAE